MPGALLGKSASTLRGRFGYHGRIRGEYIGKQIMRTPDSNGGDNMKDPDFDDDLSTAKAFLVAMVVGVLIYAGIFMAFLF